MAPPKLLSTLPMAARARERSSVMTSSTLEGSLSASVLVVCLAACEPPPMCERKEPLVTAEGWRFVEPAEDRIWPAPADAAVCDASAIQIASFGVEQAVEIDTRYGCGWATAVQPIASSLSTGDRVQVRVFYFSQVTFPAAEAAVSVALDGDIIVDERVPIPTPSGLIAPVVTIARDIAAGAHAHFHVGNHGDNSWNLIEFSRLFDAPCDDGP